MSMFGVPYSPIVPSLTRWHSGACSRIANSRLRVPTTLLTWVKTACLRSIIEYGAARCSAKWTTASGRARSITDAEEIVVGDVSGEGVDVEAGQITCQTRNRSVQRPNRRQRLHAELGSHCRRAKLSTIETEWPFFERYSAVAHPQSVAAQNRDSHSPVPVTPEKSIACSRLRREQGGAYLKAGGRANFACNFSGMSDLTD